MGYCQDHFSLDCFLSCFLFLIAVWAMLNPSLRCIVYFYPRMMCGKEALQKLKSRNNDYELRAWTGQAPFDTHGIRFLQ